jgi:hypothetical protein
MSGAQWDVARFLQKHKQGVSHRAAVIFLRAKKKETYCARTTQ